MLTSNALYYHHHPVYIAHCLLACTVQYEKARQGVRTQVHGQLKAQPLRNSVYEKRRVGKRIVTIYCPTCHHVWGRPAYKKGI